MIVNLLSILSLAATAALVTLQGMEIVIWKGLQLQRRKITELR